MKHMPVQKMDERKQFTNADNGNIEVPALEGGRVLTCCARWSREHL